MQLFFAEISCIRHAVKQEDVSVMTDRVDTKYRTYFFSKEPKAVRKRERCLETFAHLPYFNFQAFHKSSRELFPEAYFRNKMLQIIARKYNFILTSLLGSADVCLQYFQNPYPLVVTRKI